MAFILVQHLDPNHHSMLVDLLASHTSMPVKQATEAMLVEADLRGANLKGAIFLDADLTGADLREANTDGADFRGARGRT